MPPRTRLLSAAVAAVGLASTAATATPRLAGLLEADRSAVEACAVGKPCETPTGRRALTQIRCDGPPAQEIAQARAALEGDATGAVGQEALRAGYGEALAELARLDDKLEASGERRVRSEVDRRAAADQLLIQAMMSAPRGETGSDRATAFWLARAQCRLLADNSAFIRRYVGATDAALPEAEADRTAVFILVQHAEDDRLRRALIARATTDALANGAPLPEEIASLWDRLEIGRTGVQAFGSHFLCRAGRATLDPPVASPARAAELRRRYRMITLDERRAQMDSACRGSVG